MDKHPIPQFVRSADRFREVVTILAKHGLADWLTLKAPAWVSNIVRSADSDTESHLTTEQRIRVAITELGATFIKLGQVLSTRPDVVGNSLADELAGLRADTPADDPAVVRAMLELELGGSLDQHFAAFEETAMASASIGQVHRARLHTGEEVVVKVQHGGIEQKIVNDLDILRRLAELAERHSDYLRQYRPVLVVREFKQTLMRELDFARERTNAETFRRNFANDPTVRFAKPVTELCSRRVLTMERFVGVCISDKATLQSSGVDLNAVARRGATLFLDMIFRDGFYHADPHPGNLMVLEAIDVADESQPEHQIDVIGVLDCGMVGRVDESLREDLERVLIAAASQDATAIAEVMVRLGEVPADFDEQSLSDSIEDFLADYMVQSLDEFDISGCLAGIVQVIRDYHIVLPSKISMLLKVFMMLEGTSRQLNPQFSLAELIQPYARKAATRRLSPRRAFRRMKTAAMDWNHLLEILPKDAADILHNIKRGRFDVHLEHRRLEPIVNRLVMGILTAALFIGSASLWSNQVPPLAWNSSVPGVLGSLAATTMGWIIVRQISRSE
ncbi:ubiquinone biosynthesis protein [Neorhodopirellula lusitana]|uniref:Ubiquinone biosynthesis protein n=1 Tax=Neorhodopirellula lusitana TaxID=445327 RepID=A0ABY1QDU8_9BACT|nr:AarF/ABC1/UbiB kinase family protein [Neorhodopirellula lusitana]SMP66716.1 ubiquinone biosynthesis protein [Neorhodopirellula lusitana]